MAIKEEVTQSYFMVRFNEVRPNNFSYRGLETLYNYLWDLSEDIGEDIELDVIAICCDYTEYDNEEELIESYSDFIPTYTDKSNCLDLLREHTTVLEIEDSPAIIIQAF